MKLSLVLVLFLCSAAQAAGPKFKHSDKYAQQEFENVYQDIRKGGGGGSSAIPDPLTVSKIIVSTITASSATITNLTVTNLSGVTLGKLKQVVYSSTTAQTATTSTSFVNTTLALTITPSAGSNIILRASGVMGMNPNATQYHLAATIANGTTSLLGTNGGCEILAFPVATGFNYTVCAMQAIDVNPGSTAQVYRVRIKVEDPAATGQWRPDSNFTSYLIAEEYTP